MSCRLFGVAILVLALCAAVTAQSLSVHHVNVGQGSATLIVGPTGKAALVDAGAPGQGTATLVPLLTSLGVSFVDYVIVTHFHNDHWGGVPDLLSAGLGIGVVYDRGTANQPGSIGSYLAAIGSLRTTIAPGTVMDMGGGAALTCVVVNGNVVGGGFSDPTQGAQEENSRSIGLRLSYGGYDEAICGDLTGGGNNTANVESTAATSMGDVDVLVLSHHGSNTSSNQTWVNTLDAEIGVISCGDGNPYGHPHVEPMARFLGNPATAQLYRLEMGSSNAGGTVVNGDLRITTDGSTYTVSGGQVPTVTYNVDSNVGPPPPPPPPPPSTSLTLPGDLVVSEYMNNPAAVPDADGEWLEVVNTTASALNLSGFVVRDQDFDSFVLPAMTILPRGRLVFGVNGDPSENGGVSLDHVWPSGSFFLSNGSDEIELVDASGHVLDSVVYDNGATFPDPTGRSVERSNLKALPVASNFTLSTTVFGQGDDGTPGAVNSADSTGPWITLTPGGNFGLGTQVTLTVSAGVPLAGRSYLLAMSECAVPGFPLGTSGRVVDLCPTPLAWYIVQTPEIPGLLSGFQGSLNILGVAVATIQVPNVPAFSGSTFHLSGVVFDGAAPMGMWVMDNVRAALN